MSSIFMVYSVSAVPISGKVTRERGRREQSSDKYEQNGKSDFSEILQQEVEEIKSAPASFRTVTYGKDSRLHPFEYRVREYNL